MPRIVHKLAILLLAAGALIGALFVWTRTIEERRVEAACPDVLHYSYFSTPGVFDDGYARAKPQKANARIKGLLVPHHLLAAPLIAEAFETVATQRAVTVVLLSPNHFSAGTAPLLTTAAAWRTPYGQLASDCDAVERLARNGALAVEETPFEKEHGISGIVPFIKKSLPNARIVPIIVKDAATDQDLERALSALRDVLGSRMLVVASFDFSHDMTDTAAEFHDRKSLAVVERLDDERARVLDIDSIPGLRLAMRLLDSVGAGKFSLLAGSNSSRLMKRPEQPDVTSYIVGTFASGKKTANPDVTLLAFGDMMLARGVEATIVSRGAAFLFAGMPRLFKGSDLVTANAEGVFADVPAAEKPNAPDDLRFPFAPRLLPILKRAGFTHLGEANNHAVNFGNEALQASRGLIREAGLETFGDPSNQGEVMSLSMIGDRKVAQIGYHQFSGHGTQEVLNAVAEAKKQHAFTVVYPHWGVEYERFPIQAQKALAHAFIDAGADVVIGAHPHVIQPIEVYNGKAIFYSLGNFIFDQPFSPATSEGLAVGMADDGKATTFYLLPFGIRANQPALMSYEKSGRLLRTLANDSVVPGDLKNAIANGIFTLTHSL